MMIKTVFNCHYVVSACQRKWEVWKLLLIQRLWLSVCLED